MMKAAQIERYGGPEVITIAAAAPRPTPGDGQILVEVRAASLNPVDSYIRSGHMDGVRPLSFPATLGTDFAGVVVALGPGTSGFAVGDAVYGVASQLLGGWGSLADFTYRETVRPRGKVVVTG